MHRTAAGSVRLRKSWRALQSVFPKPPPSYWRTDCRLRLPNKCCTRRRRETSRHSSRTASRDSRSATGSAPPTCIANGSRVRVNRFGELIPMICGAKCPHSCRTCTRCVKIWPVTILDAASGETLATCEGTKFAREIVVAENTALLVADHGKSNLPNFRRVGTYVWSNTEASNTGWGRSRTPSSIVACGLRLGQASLAGPVARGAVFVGCRRGTDRGPRRTETGLPGPRHRPEMLASRGNAPDDARAQQHWPAGAHLPGHRPAGCQQWQGIGVDASRREEGLGAASEAQWPHVAARSVRGRRFGVDRRVGGQQRRRCLDRLRPDDRPDQARIRVGRGSALVPPPLLSVESEWHVLDYWAKPSGCAPKKSISTATDPR